MDKKTQNLDGGRSSSAARISWEGKGTEKKKSVLL